MYQISSNEMLNTLISNIEQTVAIAKEKLATSVNTTITETYWQIGKYIVETEQDGNIKAAYGKKLLTTLSHELTLRLGKGYSRPNLNNMTPIGIIMSRNKDELLVEYATYGMDSNLFVSKYELYLPNREDLERLVSNILKDSSGES